MILSAFEQRKSPFIWLQFTGPDGKKKYRKTSIRKTDEDRERRVALALNALELELLAAGHGIEPKGDRGWHWVHGYLSTRYASRLGTLETYRRQWKPLTVFLRGQGLRDPLAITREECFRYVEWRQAEVKEKSGRSPTINTALGELKLLGLVMDEAVRRGLASSNPARKLEIARAPVSEKPELSDEEIGIIYRALGDRPAWMQRAFHIALHTGLRFAETQLKRTNIRNGVIHIGTPKGGAARAFSIPIYPEIAEMVGEFMAGREALLWTLPPAERKITGLIWSKFFREIRLPHLCFHCTRVTFITRGARAGVPLSAMMKMVNHASETVHRIYQRVSVGDALALRARFAIPSFAGATVRNRSGK